MKKKAVIVLAALAIVGAAVVGGVHYANERLWGFGGFR